MQLTGRIDLESVKKYGPIAVWRDGVEHKAVIEADTDEGWIICPVYDSDGRIVANGDEIATIKLRGKVVAKTMEYPA